MQLDETRKRLSQTPAERSDSGPRSVATSPSGLVLVDKPAGPSSFAVVRATAREFASAEARRRTKAGHAGTLDPAATGLLLVLVGRATRLAQYMVGLDKRYLTEIRLGATTTTGDAQGDLAERTARHRTDALADELVGELELPVPAASAIKIDGERAYARHRRGEQVEMPIRRSTIHGVEIVDHARDRVTLELHVSSGTYVRAIAQHLGGHCLSIRRLSVGPFNVEDADGTTVVSPLDALAFLPRVDIDEAAAAALRNGRQIACRATGLARAAHADELIAVVSSDGTSARPETVLAQ